MLQKMHQKSLNKSFWYINNTTRVAHNSHHLNYYIPGTPYPPPPCWSSSQFSKLRSITVLKWKSASKGSIIVAKGMQGKTPNWSSEILIQCNELRHYNRIRWQNATESVRAAQGNILEFSWWQDEFSRKKIYFHIMKCNKLILLCDCKPVCLWINDPLRLYTISAR